MKTLTRPIIGIENRTAQEVFDIMSNRVQFELCTLCEATSPAVRDGHCSGCGARNAKGTKTLTNNLSGYDGEAGMHNLTPKQAALALILMGKGQESAIRPGLFTGQDANALIEVLKGIAGESE